MDIFNKKKIQALEKEIQAVEGGISNVILESLLTSTALSSAGTENVYNSYASQTNEIYQKYNGKAALGNWQLRSVIDTRTAFIAGEGLSVICKDKKTEEFINDFLTKNKLYGSRFINAVKQAEMEGRELLYLKVDKKQKRIKVLRHLSNYCGGIDYEVIYADKNDSDSIKDIILKKKGGNKESLREKFVYVLTGGDGSNKSEPTTRAGLVLWEIESFDRSKNAMRKNNHLFGKVTPHFSSENNQDVANFKALARSKDWKIGDIIASLKGDFKLVVPQMGAMDNLKAEQITCSKAIAATTGIPVHWFGHVDLMSNRATADTLYETINNATILDRTIWQESIHELIVKAQEMAINEGFHTGTINDDFEVKIPLMSFTKLKEHVAALSLAYADEAISIDSYRNMLPGVNPYKEKQMLEDDIKNALTGLKNDGSIIDDKEQDDEKTDE